MKNIWIGLGLAWGMASGAVASQVVCLGQIVPGEKVVRMAAPPGAIVGELRVERGDHVDAGSILAVLRDEPWYRAQWVRTQRQVDVAQAELDLALAGERPELLKAQEWFVAASEAEAHGLQLRLERHGTLETGRHISLDEHDDIVARLDSLRARIRREKSVLLAMRTARGEEMARAEAALRFAEAQAAEAEAMWELQRIRAPMAGEVLEVHARPGEGIWDGGAVVSLGDTANMQIVAEVYETDVGRVQVGQRAMFRGQAFPGEAGGEVIEVQRMMEGSRVFPMLPSEYVDRRITLVRIRPDHPEAFAAFSHAHVTVTILAP